MRFYKGKAGQNAYRVSHVWRLGFHVFNNGGDRIIRLCYFRGKNTHYIQLSWVVKADLQCEQEEEYEFLHWDIR